MKEDLEKQIKAIVFDDEFEILGKIKFNNEETVGVQTRRFIVQSLVALVEREKEEAVKQVRYGNIGRCPRHDEALRCRKCLKELNEASA